MLHQIILLFCLLTVCRISDAEILPKEGLQVVAEKLSVDISDLSEVNVDEENYHYLTKCLILYIKISKNTIDPIATGLYSFGDFQIFGLSGTRLDVNTLEELKKVSKKNNWDALKVYIMTLAISLQKNLVESKNENKIQKVREIIKKSDAESTLKEHLLKALPQ